MDEEEIPRARGGGAQPLLQFRVDQLERKMREHEARMTSINEQHERRCREVVEQFDRRIKEFQETLTRQIKEIEDSGDKRTGRIETFLLSGLGLVATLFIGALFTLLSGSSGVPK